MKGNIWKKIININDTSWSLFPNSSPEICPLLPKIDTLLISITIYSIIYVTFRDYTMTNRHKRGSPVGKNPLCLQPSLFLSFWLCIFYCLVNCAWRTNHSTCQNRFQENTLLMCIETLSKWHESGKILCPEICSKTDI